MRTCSICCPQRYPGPSLQSWDWISLYPTYGSNPLNLQCSIRFRIGLNNVLSAFERASHIPLSYEEDQWSLCQGKLLSVPTSARHWTGIKLQASPVRCAVGPYHGLTQKTAQHHIAIRSFSHCRTGEKTGKMVGYIGWDKDSIIGKKRKG